MILNRGINMLVRDIMTRDVVTITSDETILDACNKYSKHRVGCLVVVDEDNPEGIITERDIIEKIIRRDRDPKTTKVKDIMTSNLKMIHASAKIEDAAKMMRKYNIKKLPVILNNKIVGIVTVTDLSNLFPEFFRQIPQDDQSY